MILGVFAEVTFGGCRELGTTDSREIFAAQPVQLFHKPSVRCTSIKMAHRTPRFQSTWYVASTLRRVAQFRHAVGEQEAGKRSPYVPRKPSIIFWSMASTDVKRMRVMPTPLC